MLELAASTDPIACLSLVAGRGEVVEAAQELALVWSDELEDFGEGSGRGRVFAALQVTLGPPESRPDA